ncbi:MAG TPA: hypothetical protein PLY88_05205 [Candidatus Omnitrophota bacterium]|nr:hypothetical protein [Candidatus Omnitrophota bacterium]
MNQIKRYGFSAMALAAGLLLATSVWAADEDTIGGTVENVNTTDQSFTLVATPEGVPAGSAEVNVKPATDYVGVSGLEALEDGDRVEVETGARVDGEFKADTVTKV